MSNWVQQSVKRHVTELRLQEVSFMARNRWRKSPVPIRRVPLDQDTRLLIEATVDQLIRVAPHAGFSIRDLNNFLDSGMELEELVDFIATGALKRAA